jgi:hypothetical protein
VRSINWDKHGASGCEPGRHNGAAAGPTDHATPPLARPDTATAAGAAIAEVSVVPIADHRPRDLDAMVNRSG